MLKVCQRPELIQQLQHGLSFADDATVNNALLVKYSLWDYLTPCDADNINILNSCIQRWRDEANKLYETTLFQYNPIENYDMEEKGKDKRTPDLTDETTYGGTNTYSEAGYDVPRTLYDKGKNTAGGKDTTTKKGTETKDHELRRHGNIGVTTTQQMIEMERKIILDTLSWYVDKFRECFNVSMSISDYECCEMDMPVCRPERNDNELEGIKDDIRHLNTEVGLLQEGEAALDAAVQGLDGRVETLEGCCEDVRGDISTLQDDKADKLLRGGVDPKMIALDGPANGPLVKCILRWNPSQDGSGDPSPSNPRSIYSNSGGSVNVSPTTVVGDGVPYPVDWSGVAGDVYGGTFNYVTGELTVTWAAVDMGSLTWTQSPADPTAFYTTIANRAHGNKYYGFCDIYKWGGYASSIAAIISMLHNYEFGYRNNAKVVVVKDNRYATAAALTTGVSGHYIVYELSTPLVYNLTPTDVLITPGDNYVIQQLIGLDTEIAVEYMVSEYQGLLDFIINH